MTSIDKTLPSRKITKAETPKSESPIEQTFVLSEREAEAASPEFLAVCGEEDPGEGLELLVTEDKDDLKN